MMPLETSAMTPATTTAQPRSRAISAAAFLYLLVGLGFAIANLFIVRSARRTGRLPEVFGIEFLAGPVSRRYGLNAALAGTVPLTVICLLEAVAGYWLWQSRRKGGVLALLLFPVALVFWIAYELPVPLVIGPIRLLLLALGWKSLRQAQEQPARDRI